MFGSLAHDLAIDLGTANTVVHARGRGIVAREPSVVAVGPTAGGMRRPIAVGTEAMEMWGRTPPEISVVRPLQKGVITDFEITAILLERMMRMAGTGRRLLRPRVAIAIPASTSDVERRALRESAMFAGAREVHLVPQAMAAVIGLGMSVMEPSGHMVIDIGAGTTEVSVVSLGGVVCSSSVRVAGDEMDAAITRYLKSHYNLLIGERSAESVKLQIGAAEQTGDMRSVEVRGRDLFTGVPAAVELKAEEVCTALADPVQVILEQVRLTLEQTPPELAGDLADRGIVMVGSGSLLPGLDARLRESIALPVIVAGDASTSVALGTGICLASADLLSRIALTS